MRYMDLTEMGTNVLIVSQGEASSLQLAEAAFSNWANSASSIFNPAAATFSSRWSTRDSRQERAHSFEMWVRWQ